MQRQLFFWTLFLTFLPIASFAGKDTLLVSDEIRLSLAMPHWQYGSEGISGFDLICRDHPDVKALVLVSCVYDPVERSIDSMVREQLYYGKLMNADSVWRRHSGSYDIVCLKAKEGRSFGFTPARACFASNGTFTVEIRITTEHDYPGLDTLTDELCRGIHINTPEEMDKIQGLPLNIKDSAAVVTRRLAKAISEKGGRQIDDYQLKRITSHVHDQIAYHCTNKEYYRNYKPILGAHIPLSEWLESEFGGPHPPAVKYCYRCTESLPIFDQSFYSTVDSFARAALMVPPKQKVRWQERIKMGETPEDGGWGVITSYVERDKPLGVYLINFQKGKDGKWTYLKNYFDESKTQDNHLIISQTYNVFTDEYSSYDASPAFMAINNNTRNIWYIGNAESRQTNFIRMDLSERETLRYTVEYSGMRDTAQRYYFYSKRVHKVNRDKNEAIEIVSYTNDGSGKDKSSFLEPNITYTSYINSKYKPYRVISDDSLMAKIKDVPGVYYDPKERWKVDEDKAYEAAMIALKVKIKPENRIYKSAPVFEDLNGDGVKECYVFAISNGDLIYCRVLKLTATGVSEIQADTAMISRIQSTPLYARMKQVSVMPENDEKAFESGETGK